VVNLATGLKRRIAGADAVDPRVSPDGKFVAFWALPVDTSGSQFAGADRDIWIQPLAGGPGIQVTNGESSDWNPAWSADGRFLFFSSDRSGPMNIWRVAIDPATGRPSGDPVATTAPASYVSDMTVGADGTIAYTAFDYDSAIRAAAFDPQAAEVQGAPRDVVAGHRMWLHPDVSPDGRLLTMRSYRAQEDVWVVGVDGSGLRQATNDPARDRGSRFAPDGSILYYSSRGGSYRFWSVRPDGSDNRLLTPESAVLNYPLPSPDGRWVAGTNPNINEQFIFDAHDWTKAPERLPQAAAKGQNYLRDWSPDGTRLVAADISNTLWVFDRGARTWDRAGTGALPRWLPDGRRLLAISRGRIEVVDTATKSARDIYEEPGRFIGAVALSRDGRSLYYTSSITQSDIWTMRFAR
jgi:Tol biopolymer transport system component